MMARRVWRFHSRIVSLRNSRDWPASVRTAAALRLPEAAFSRTDPSSPRAAGPCARRHLHGAQLRQPPRHPRSLLRARTHGRPPRCRQRNARLSLQQPVQALPGVPPPTTVSFLSPGVFRSREGSANAGGPPHQAVGVGQAFVQVKLVRNSRASPTGSRGVKPVMRHTPSPMNGQRASISDFAGRGLSSADRLRLRGSLEPAARA